MSAASGQTLRADEITVGDVLPELEIPLTRTVIVSTAIASRDYQDVHHDPQLAQERGSDDIFMNILSTNGFVGRYITDWAGPGAIINEVSIRLGAPNYPGDTMVFSGTVEDVSPPRVRVAIRGRNSRGDHVTGTVGLTLPTTSSEVSRSSIDGSEGDAAAHGAQISPGAGS